MKNNVISTMKFKFEDQLNTPKSKLNKNSSLHDVAQEFESLFVFQMLKNARQAKLADNILSNKGSETLSISFGSRVFKNNCQGTKFWSCRSISSTIRKTLEC